MAKKCDDLTYLDRSGTCIIVRCHTCTYYHGFALDTYEAWEVAARHESNLHPDSEHATARLRDIKWRMKAM